MRRRELIEPVKGHKRYIRRDARGRFTADQVAVGRSLAADRRRKAKRVVKAGQGDRGDVRRRRCKCARRRGRLSQRFKK